MTNCARCEQPTTIIQDVYFPDKHVETWCTPCWNANARKQQEDRKAQLAAMPRCEFCKRRGTFIAVGQVLLCGRHLGDAGSTTAYPLGGQRERRPLESRVRH